MAHRVEFRFQNFRLRVRISCWNLITDADILEVFELLAKCTNEPKVNITLMVMS